MKRTVLGLLLLMAPFPALGATVAANTTLTIRIENVLAGAWCV